MSEKIADQIKCIEFELEKGSGEISYDDLVESAELVESQLNYFLRSLEIHEKKKAPRLE